MASSYKRAIIKLSGELLGGEGVFNDLSIRTIGEQLIAAQDRGFEIGVVLGAGNICRGVELIKLGIDQVDADQMGMLATSINGIALASVIRGLGGRVQIIGSYQIPGVVLGFKRDEALKALSNGDILIFTGGTGNPLFTTDTAAVIRAVELKANIVLKGTKVDGVYSADPLKNDDAHLYDKISFKEAVDKRLQVIDITALAILEQSKIPLVVFNGYKKVINDILKGERVGTLVYP